MAYFFNDDLIRATNEFIPSIKKSSRKHVAASEVAKKILDKLNPYFINVEDGYLCICSNERASASVHYDEKECAAVEEELKEEIRVIFNIDAEVEFVYEGYEDLEPDPIPPLYWGDSEKAYHYKLNIRAKL